MVGGATGIQTEMIARSLGASGSREESGGASGFAPGAGFSMASEVAAQGRSSGKRERRVYLGGGDVPGLWVCRAEAAEKFPGAQVVLGASHMFSLITYYASFAMKCRTSLAASPVSLGRTVLVSSHLMSEMAMTADHLIVIGKGRLLRDQKVTEFTQASSGQRVLVRSPRLDELAARLTGAGAQVRPGPDASIEVSGLDSAAIGNLAAASGLVLHELTTQRASLKEAFMELTHDSVQYRPAGTVA